MKNGPSTTPASSGGFGLSPKKSSSSLALPSAASFSSLNMAGGGSTRSGAEGESSSGASLEASSDYAVGLLSALPASDHALAYVVLETGVILNVLFVAFPVLIVCVTISLQMILVALATFDSELYVTFPGTVRKLLQFDFLLECY